MKAKEMKRRIKVYATLSKDDVLYQGDFLGFGVRYEELRTGIGHFTSALIEQADGDVTSVGLEYIRFIKEEN